MNLRTENEAADAKQQMRRKALKARQAQPDKQRISGLATRHCRLLPEYLGARTVMWYLDCRSELRTRSAVSAALNDGKRIAIPYCTVDRDGHNQLGAWRMERFDELLTGRWGILEPPPNRWAEPERVVLPAELDVVFVPGVGFSRDGGRLGNGQGYYDRFLKQVRPECALIGLCYECQLLDQLRMEKHDVYVDRVITEKRVYAWDRIPE